MRSLSFIFLALNAVYAYHWPSPQYDELETLLYETRLEAGGAAITPALNNCIPQANRSVNAEWIRFVYHDMATHNVDDGTGGLDASLVFELDRPENVGAGMRTTLLELSGFANKYVSRSDVFALGLVLAVNSCGGPLIAYRGGRVDALQAGLSGVPQPQDTLASHTESFRRQGFTPTEMIQLVACGHTVGGVRNSDFPNIVPPRDDGQENFELFDTTPAYDDKVVTQYLDGTTANPLVVDSNTTLNSDLRIFGSDRNVTMRGLSFGDDYRQTCRIMLERLINTVPKGVTLTEVIEPLPVKVAGVQLSVGNNTLVLNASLRLLNPKPNSKRTISLQWADRAGSPCATCSVGFFNVTSASSGSIDEHDGTSPAILDNDGTGYQITQDSILFVPDRSSHEFSQNEEGFSIVVAARNDVLPSRVYANYYQRETSTNLPQNGTVEFQLDSTNAPTAGYNFYTGFIQAFGQLSFDLFSVVDGTTYSEGFRQTIFIGI